MHALKIRLFIPRHLLNILLVDIRQRRTQHPPRIHRATSCSAQHPSSIRPTSVQHPPSIPISAQHHAQRRPAGSLPVVSALTPWLLCTPESRQAPLRHRPGSSAAPRRRQSHPPSTRPWRVPRESLVSSAAAAEWL